MSPSRVFQLLESRTVLLVGVIVIAVADSVIFLSSSSPPQAVKGVFDEPAHLATTVIVLAALGWWGGGWFVGGAMVASVAIDLDHVPGYLGFGFLAGGTPRPYTHSLLTVLVVVFLGLAFREHWREVLLGAGLGVLGHFFRDVSEPGEVGVALLWPISDNSFQWSYAIYVAVMAGLVPVGLLRQSRRRASEQAPSTGRR